MRTYIFKFKGREKGAIGVFYPCHVEILANSEEEARLMVYDTHEPYVYCTLVGIK